MIDTESTNNIDYETWMKAMDRLSINMDELIYKRVFWYLNFTTQYKGVDKRALDRFVMYHSSFINEYKTFGSKLVAVLK